MNKQTTTSLSALTGIILIAMGLLATALTAGMPLLGLRMWSIFEIWRYWPLTVISLGLGFALPPFLYRDRRGLGGLFIPGVPILATGGILLFTSVLNWWSAWSWLWPLEVLAVAAGFALAAVHMRVIWLWIPAIIIGANGLLCQFCAITGLWEVWAAMWTIEPLSVGLSLLLIGARQRRPGLLLAGLILCSLSGFGLMGMLSILSASWVWSGWWWALRLFGPVTLILAGILLLAWGLAHRAAPFKAAR